MLVDRRANSSLTVVTTGPISSISIFGQHIVIINEMKLAFEMLDKKSSLFSDRPVLQFAGVM